jgi:fructose-specific phosphotransferase system IIC component
MTNFMSKKIHKLWLKVTGVAIFGYAFLFSLGAIKMFQEPIRFILDISNFPLDNAQNYDAPTTVFLSAIIGGVLAGWGVMILLMSIWFYDQSPEKVRKTVLFGLLTWFFVDSLGCIISGDGNNAMTNIVLLLLLVGPLWTSARE